jgi:hypothetical protein
MDARRSSAAAPFIKKLSLPFIIGSFFLNVNTAEVPRPGQRSGMKTD